MKKTIITTLVLATTLFACQKNAITGRRSLDLMPESEMIGIVRTYNCEGSISIGKFERGHAVLNSKLGNIQIRDKVDDHSEVKADAPIGVFGINGKVDNKSVVIVTCGGGASIFDKIDQCRNLKRMKTKLSVGLSKLKMKMSTDR